MNNNALKGWVYIMTNKAMPGLVKVGYTMKDPSLRAKELNHTGSPHPYVVAYEALIVNPREIEQTTHFKLSDFHEGKEWFNCPVDDAISAIKSSADSNILLENNKNTTAKGTKKFCTKCSWLYQSNSCDICSLTYGSKFKFRLSSITATVINNNDCTVDYMDNQGEKHTIDKRFIMPININN